MLKSAAVMIFAMICFEIYGYTTIRRSEAYAFAIKTIEESFVIKERLGPIKHAHLALFSGGSFTYGRSCAQMEFQLIVIGDKQGGHVYFNAEKATGGWRMIKGDLFVDGDSVAIPI
jgi:hypothetical protein